MEPRHGHRRRGARPPPPRNTPRVPLPPPTPRGSAPATLYNIVLYEKDYSPATILYTYPQNIFL